MKRALDLGRSNLRMQYKSDDLRVFSSKYKEIPADANIRKDLPEPMEDFIIETSPWKSLNGRRFVKGLAVPFYVGTENSADNQDLKSEQDDTYINAAYALATGILVSKLPRVGELVELGVCIPTAEFYSADSDKIKVGLAGNYVVYFPAMKKRVEFKVPKRTISITPEGVVALLPLLKGEYGPIIKTKNVMVIDAGYGSLDITIVKRMQPEGGASRSFPIAGITLEAIVAGELEKSGINASSDVVRNAIETGLVDNGSGTVPVGAVVQHAKQVLAGKIRNAMVQVLAIAGMSRQEINYILPIGRCFSYAGTEKNSFYTGDLAKYILDGWKTNLGVIRVKNLETANVEGVSMGLRASADKV